MTVAITHAMSRTTLARNAVLRLESTSMMLTLPRVTKSATKKAIRYNIGWPATPSSTTQPIDIHASEDFV